MWYSSRGQIFYNGKWVICTVNNSIIRYYNWWARRLTWKSISTPISAFERYQKLNVPANYSLGHITIINGRRIDCSGHKNWLKYQGQWVDFEYSNIIEYSYQKNIHATTGVSNDGTYYWLEVRCGFFKKIRDELGLGEFVIKPHATIGFWKK